MDSTKKLIIVVAVVVVLTILAFVFVRGNNINFVSDDKNENDGIIYFNIHENYNKHNNELSASSYFYKEDFPLLVKKHESMNIPTMYGHIPVSINKISKDDVVTVKSQMPLHNKEDYSDEKFNEFTINPGENLTLYFDSADTQGYITARYEK